MYSKSVIDRATKLLLKRQQDGSVCCNCGGPQYGTDHAPDCALNLAWDDAIAEAYCYREK